MTERYTKLQIDSIASDIGDRIKNRTTDAAIKAAYESNADTNVFTDAEKDKLASVQTTQTYKTITGDYTVIDDDLLGCVVILVDSTAAAITITLPSGLLNVNTLTIVRNGTNDVTIVDDGTTVIHSADGRTKLRSLYSAASLFQSATDVYNLIGDIDVV